MPWTCLNQEVLMHFWGCFIAKLKPINDIRVDVQFTHTGLIGSQIGFNKVKALAEKKRT